MLRHEYADHVAALVFAQLVGTDYADLVAGHYTPERDSFELMARMASDAANALAAVRYPEVREAVSADTCEYRRTSQCPACRAKAGA